MPGNRRRNANAVPLAMMASWITVCLALAVAGLCYVWVKNDLHASGRAMKELERDYDSLVKQNEAARARIVEASSTHELGKLFNERNRFNGMRPIADDSKVVVVGRPPRGLVESKDDEFQRIANREGAPR